MRTRWWLAAVWAAFAVRLAFYATAFPIWEGFDEWAHFAVVRHVAMGEALVPRDAVVPLDVATSMQQAPMPPTIASLPSGAVTHDQFWKLPPEERAAREAEFRHIPADFAAQSGTIGAYETLQPPLYYWISAPVLRIFQHGSLATQVLALRWAAAAIGSLVIPLIFVLARAAFHDERMALGCSAVAALLPELAITTARVSNECLAIPLYTAATWLAIRRGHWLALGVVLGAGMLTKAYFLAALLGIAVAFWAPRALLVAVAISGWWYLRNYLTTGTISGLSEAVALRNTPSSTLLHSIGSIPWMRAFDSILFSHLYFGGWSSLTVRSWMYHLLYAGIALATLGMIALLKKPEMRALMLIYGVFWLAQLYNVVLIYATKGVPTSMGWYLYAVVGAEVVLALAGLRRILGGWAIGAAAIAFGLLDLYAMNAIALPYYAGLLGRKANGALAGIRVADIHPGELFQRLTAFKPEFVSAGGMAALWAVYLLATLALMAAAAQLGRSLKR